MAEFLQFLFSGLTVGAIYALVALGFTIIYNATDVINFAQGEFVMIGGMSDGLRSAPPACRCRSRRSLAIVVAVARRLAAGEARDRAGARRLGGRR